MLRRRKNARVLDRARREAILRMKAEAHEHGAGMIFNVKLETASISKGAKDTIGSVEVYAYGTAVTVQLDNTIAFTHVVAPHDIDGFTFGLNTGMIGFDLIHHLHGLNDTDDIAYLDVFSDFDKRG